MRAVAWKMLGNVDHVDDTLQDAYMKVHRSIDRFRGDAAFGTWLHRIVTNTCVDHLRNLSNRNEVSIDRQREIAVPAADDRLSDVERVREALLALPAEQRVAVLLIDCEGYSYEEAAAMLRISCGAVGSRLFRARATLNAIGEQT